MTQDLDLVIDAAATRNRDELLAALIEAGFYLEESTARAAIAGKRMFEILDIEDALKLDLYLEDSIPGERDRSVMAEGLRGLTLPIAARSDAALSKLIWASKGSHKSRRDLRQILSRATSVVRARFSAESAAPPSPLDSHQSWRPVGDGAESQIPVSLSALPDCLEVARSRGTLPLTVAKACPWPSR